MDLSSPRSIRAGLQGTGYLADDDLATVVYLAHGMQRPLLLEGEPGTGKTALAEALAELADVPLIRLQCYEGIDATQALYDWDFPRQILHLRTLEAATKAGELDANEAEKSLFDERFLLARPVLRALREAPAVLLVDEVDRADDEFEAFLLEVLSSWTVSIPSSARSRLTPPTVVLTSNRTRELHDALKRRCLYHWIDHPGSSARSPSSAVGCPRSASGWPSRSPAPCSSCETRTCSSRPAWPRPWTGRGRCTVWVPTSSTWRRPPGRSVRW